MKLFMMRRVEALERAAAAAAASSLLFSEEDSKLGRELAPGEHMAVDLKRGKVGGVRVRASQERASRIDGDKGFVFEDGQIVGVVSDILVTDAGLIIYWSAATAVDQKAPDSSVVRAAGLG